MTAQELISASERKGFEYEINQIGEFFSIKEFELGIKYKKDVWAWFTYTESTDCQATFKHTYNRANGCKRGGFKRWIKIEMKITE